jgi:hypothetical protein
MIRFLLRWTARSAIMGGMILQLFIYLAIIFLPWALLLGLGMILGRLWMGATRERRVRVLIEGTVRLVRLLRRERFYTDGHAYCFSCGALTKGEGSEEPHAPSVRAV